jgi:hypothetical protein
MRAAALILAVICAVADLRVGKKNTRQIKLSRCSPPRVARGLAGSAKPPLTAR